MARASSHSPSRARARPPARAARRCLQEGEGKRRSVPAALIGWEPIPTLWPPQGSLSPPRSRPPL
eukprot:2809788-Prymnesium_polylepis.3